MLKTLWKKIKWFFDVQPVTDRKRFYLLSFTWGILMNAAGLIASLAMLVTGHRPKRFGPCIYFEQGKDWGGMSWGLFLIVNRDPGERLLAHELGHAMQNCRFGPLMPLLVGLPSSLRWWARKLWKRVTGREPKRPYDAAWFEGQATAVGSEYMKMTAV